MVPELVVLALEYYRAPLRYRHLADPKRPLPKQFSALISELGSALSAQKREATAHTLGVAPHELEQAAGFFLRDVLLTPGADHYRVLGLTRQCPPEAIRQHYQLLVGIFHPDRSTSDAERDAVYTARLNDAYNTLRNPEKRARYDEQTRRSAAASHSDVDDRDFFRPLTSIEPFLQARAAPAAASRFSARQVATISALAALALGLTLLVLLGLSPPPTLRASLDLRDQPAPKPAYLAQPEAVEATGRQRSNQDNLHDQHPIGAEPAARGDPSAPLVAPGQATSALELAQADPPPTATRDAIRAAALAGLELPLRHASVVPKAIDMPPTAPRERLSTARSTTPGHDRPPEPRALAEGTTAQESSGADPRTTRSPPPGTRPPSKQAPVSGSARPTAEASTLAPLAQTATATAEQSLVTATEPTPAPKPQTAITESASSAMESAKDTAPAINRNATAATATLLPEAPEAPPTPAALPPKESSPTTARAPEKPTTPKREPPAQRESVPDKGSRPPAEETPKKPVVEPRPKGPPPLSPTDVVNRLTHAYQSGDLNGLMSLFAANAQINGGRGTAHIRSRYADMFSRLPERRLSIHNLSWRKGRGDRLVGNGAVQVSARTGPQSSWGHATGTITLELASTVGGYRIAKMIHRLD